MSVYFGHSYLFFSPTWRDMFIISHVGQRAENLRLRICVKDKQTENSHVITPALNILWSAL